MPRRWLSRRGRQPNTPSPAPFTDSGKQSSDFDFAFPGNQLAASPSVQLHSIERRPTTSSGLDAQSEKKLHNYAPVARPRTSDAHRAHFNPLCHRPTASGSQDDLIGVAYGSPGHPPVSFRTPTTEMSPSSPDHAFGQHGPLQDRQRRIFPRSWKKIGALFASRHSAQKTTVPTADSDQTRDRPLQASKSDEALPKQSWFKYKVQIQEPPAEEPPPPPPDKDEDGSIPHKDPPQRICNIHGKTMLLDPSPFSSPRPDGDSGRPVQQPVRSAPLPQLEITIPSQPPDIHDTQAKNTPTAPASSSLLQRRRRTLDSLGPCSSDNNSISEPEDRPALEKDASMDGGDELLPVPTRSDQSLPKPEFQLKLSSSSPTLRKYSLFPPASPSTEKGAGKVQQASPLKRSLTSPAQLSPMQSIFPVTKPQPLDTSNKTSSDNQFASPDANTASSEVTAPWSSINSKGSSISSANTDEIFFDIKSLRDSRGLEDGKHFVMARPDSAVVELARTRSRLKSSASKEPTNKPTPPVKTEESSSISSINPAVFDEAIAAVEELSLPQTKPELPQDVKPSPEKNPPSTATATTPSPVSTTATGKPPITKRDLELKLLPPDGVLPRAQSKARVDPPNTKFTVPSPIVEEVSPVGATSLAPEKTTPISKALSDPAVLPVQSKETKEMKQDALPVDTTTAAPVLNMSARKPVPNSGVVPAPQPTAEPAKLYPARVRAIQQIDHPIQESPTIPQSPPPRPYSPTAALAGSDKPPPVPRKDARYIPLSKYAARSTISKIELVGVRPARLDRAATDSFVPTTSRGTRVERSATIPPPRSNSSLGIHTGQTGLRSITTVVQARPTAEVSVARTVSLTRKQSSKVLVPGPKLAARRKEMAEQEEKKRQEGSGSSSAVVPVAVNGPQDPLRHNESQVRGQYKAENFNPHSPMSEPPSASTPALTTPPPNITAPAISRKALSNLRPLASHPMDSETSLASGDSHVSGFSFQAEISKAQEKTVQTKGRGRKEVQEGMRMSPVVVVEGLKGHKPGASVGVVLDTA
ncbi:hypothetical protein DV738_g3639, partial [Chaetothyriales sp. CBS 135597]